MTRLEVLAMGPSCRCNQTVVRAGIDSVGLGRPDTSRASRSLLQSQASCPRPHHMDQLGFPQGLGASGQSDWSQGRGGLSGPIFLEERWKLLHLL